jgi:hypothetical protein
MESNQIFDAIFGIRLKITLSYQLPEIFEKNVSLSSGKKYGLLRRKFPISALNLKQLITPEILNIFSF